MSNIRQTGTSQELTARAILHSLGYAFDTKAIELPGTPDIVNRSDKWAIYVHGCFWHAHTCPLWKIPKTNPQFWREKFVANKRRDKTKLKQLRKRGYSVLTLWQCQLSNQSTAVALVRRFMAKIESNGFVNGHNLTVNQRQPEQTLGRREAYIYDEQKKLIARKVNKNNGEAFVCTLKVGDSPRKRDAHATFDQAFLKNTEKVRHGSLKGTVRVVDLFSGCGGLSLGVREASLALGYKFDPLLAVDENAASLKVYIDNFDPRFVSDCDICDVLTGKIGDTLQPEERALINGLGSVHVLLAGPPCQGHSDLNNHTRRVDKRNKLYDRVARFAQLTGPEHILVENVPTVVHGRGRVVEKTVTQLQRLGYNVDTGVVDLADLGVPQRRKRHVLIASHSKCLSVRNVVERYKVRRVRNIRWAIGDIKVRLDNGAFDRPSELHGPNLSRIAYLFKTGRYDLPNRLRPICHQRDHSYKSMYGRLKYTELSQTITSGFGSPGQGRFIHPARPTTLTPHEAARLQFFPDSFDFSSAELRTSLANMIGNAVPMKLSYAFCMEFMS
jgi:DNA (cytosine-5)-methyltransferase 1